MALSWALVIAFAVVGNVINADPIVNCPAPKSPENGQVFIYQEGRVVKYVCNPGYKLQGKNFIRCVGGKWEQPPPDCVQNGGLGDDGSQDDEIYPEPLPPAMPTRPLFSWDDAEKKTEEMNDTAEEKLAADDPRMRMVIYPRRQVVLTRRSQVLTTAELEEEERKRSGAKDGKAKTTTVIRRTSPSVVYVRSSVAPSKAEESTKQQYRRASVSVVSVPENQNEKGLQSDDARQYMYYLTHHGYPRRAVYDYQTGSPVVMTLSESQLAWINSLHPELRDQYLKDLYVVRAEESEEARRAHAFLNRYGVYYNHPFYVRQPVSVIVDDPIQTYDYSCNEAYSSFIKAPRLSHARVHRYDARQNPNPPQQHYLTAVYTCNPGYMMLDTRYTELHCSNRRWVGTQPVCVPRG